MDREAQRLNTLHNPWQGLELLRHLNMDCIFDAIISIKFLGCENESQVMGENILFFRRNIWG